MTAGPRAAANRGAGVKHDPYPCYRDSGVAWLGEVPEHWEVRRLKDVGLLIAGAAFPEALQGVEGEELPFFKVGDLNKSADGRWLDDTQHTITRETAAEIRARVIPRESVVYAKIGAALLLNRRRITTRPACIDNNMSAYVPSRDRVTTSWALYTLSLLDFGEHVNPGAVPSLSEGDQAILPIPLPPLDEQRAIAAFLDRETECIDALMAKKRLLIERLQEYRTALITRTVTRGLPPEAARAVGLDPAPRLKPSGVEWLGDVPEHWEVKALRRSVLLQRGHDLPADEREDGDVPIVSSAGVLGSHVLAVADGPAIVTGRYGSIGEFHLVDGPYWPLNTTLYTVDLCGNEVRFLRYLLMNLKPLFLVNAAKSAVPGVDRNDLHPVLTVVPPVAEQQAIAAFLDGEAARLAKLVERTQTAIERLQEYRTALITAAVTGKIDVRESEREQLAAN